MRFWRDLCSAFWLYNREAELLCLVAWAKRKRLTALNHVYEWRLLETQAVMQRIQLRSPQATLWAGIVHTFAAMIVPPPKYRKGTGVAYRRA